MKVLIYTSIFPFPLDQGGKLAQYTFIESLVKENDVLLVCEKYDECQKDLSVLKKNLPSLRIKLLITEQIKTSKSIKTSLWSITKKMEWRLRKKIGIMNTDEYLFFSNLPFTNPVRPKKPELIEQLLQIIKDEQPDIIQVDFIDNADIGSVLPKNIPSVLVLHDLRFSGVAQSAKLLGLKDKYADYLKEYVRTIEVNFIKLFDAAITFSDDDKNLIKIADPEINVTAIPFAVPDKNISSPESINALHKIVFIGPEHHRANYDAIQWYESEIQPEVWDKHKIKLSIAGKWSEKTIKKFSKKNGIEFLGFVDDLKEVLKSSAMIVPVRIGSGIRTKILDAFAFGIPVISTTLGCQGLHVEDGKDILIANSPEEFGAAISKLCNDKTFRARLIKNAHQNLISRFTQSKVYYQRMELYNKLLTQHSGVLVSS